DTFSFGSVLYELLTDRQAFQGETVSEVLASVLVREPDFSLVPPKLNPRIQELVQRCLQKNPKRRWQAVGDLRVELELIASSPHVATPAALLQDQRPLWKRAIPLFITAIVFSATAGVITWNLRRSETTIVMRLQLPLSEGQQLLQNNRGSIALSPDGTHLLYVANRQMFLRSMSETEARPIGDAHLNPANPFFSSDGQWIGFWSVEDSWLKKIAITGGAALTLSKLDVLPLGASWSGDVIVFGTNKGIMKISKTGGNPEVLVAIKPGEAVYGPQLIN